MHNELRVQFRDALLKRFYEGVYALDNTVSIKSKKYKDLVVNLSNTNNIILQLETDIEKTKTEEAKETTEE